MTAAVRSCRASRRLAEWPMAAFGKGEVIDEIKTKVTGSCFGSTATAKAC